MQKVVIMQDLRLPKFDKNRHINQQKVLVFDHDNIKYDIILSTNLLSKTGFKLNYSEGKLEWFDQSIPLRPPGGLEFEWIQPMEDMFHIQVKDKLLGEDWLKSFATEILGTKYEMTDVVEVMKGLTHLNAHPKADLPWVLQENKRMFDETLHVYPHEQVHTDIDPNAKPVHFMPHPVPWTRLKTFKKEDNIVRWISNSRQLNKVIRRKQYPLPIITDILRKRSGYKFFTKLDNSMQYYTFELNNKSRLLYHHHTIC